MGMAILEVAGTERYIRGLIFDSYANYLLQLISNFLAIAKIQF